VETNFPITSLQFPGKSHIKQIRAAAQVIWYRSDRTIPIEVAITEALRQHREYIIKTEKWRRGIKTTITPKISPASKNLQYRNEFGKWVDMGGVMES